MKVLLYRKAVSEEETPHIAYRVLEDHLGISYTVYRIEIRIMDEMFWLTGSQHSYRSYKQNLLCIKIKRHLDNGNLLNLSCWNRV